MTNQRSAGVVEEAERYLAAIAVFRAEGHEPRWLPELDARPRRLAGTSALDRMLLDSASRSRS